MVLPVEATLYKKVAAIQIHARENDKDVGFVSQLPKGAELRICGNGFNTRTVKVEWRGQFYFVFVQDIDPEWDGQYNWQYANGHSTPG